VELRQKLKEDIGAKDKPEFELNQSGIETTDEEREEVRRLLSLN